MEHPIGERCWRRAVHKVGHVGPPAAWAGHENTRPMTGASGSAQQAERERLAIQGGAGSAHEADQVIQFGAGSGKQFVGRSGDVEGLLEAGRE